MQNVSVCVCTCVRPRKNYSIGQSDVALSYMKWRVFGQYSQLPDSLQCIPSQSITASTAIFFLGWLDGICIHSFPIIKYHKYQSVFV